MTSSQDTLKMIYSNLQSAANLVKSFKQVSVDQTSEAPREILISNYFQTIIQSLNPKIKKAQVTVNLNCVEDCLLFTYPGAISQITTNLILNSIIHGFGDNKSGTIEIEVSGHSNVGIEIRYKDDGVGIPNDIISKVMDPFLPPSEDLVVAGSV